MSKGQITWGVSNKILESAARNSAMGPLGALEQLVDNARDAGADDISIHYGQDSITITDNGSGMSFEELKNQFFTKGDSKKRRSKENTSGQFGVATLSLHILGEQLAIQTTKDGETTDVSGNLSLEEITDSSYEYDTRKTSQSNGTKIQVSQLSFDKDDLSKSDLIKAFSFRYDPKIDLTLRVNHKKITQPTIDSTFSREFEFDGEEYGYKNHFGIISGTIHYFDKKNSHLAGVYVYVKDTLAASPGNVIGIGQTESVLTDRVAIFVNADGLNEDVTLLRDGFHKTRRVRDFKSYLRDQLHSLAREIESSPSANDESGSVFEKSVLALEPNIRGKISDYKHRRFKVDFSESPTLPVEINGKSVLIYANHSNYKGKGKAPRSRNLRRDLIHAAALHRLASSKSNSPYDLLNLQNAIESEFTGDTIAPYPVSSNGLKSIHPAVLPSQSDASASKPREVIVHVPTGGISDETKAYFKLTKVDEAKALQSLEQLRGYTSLYEAITKYKIGRSSNGEDLASKFNLWSPRDVVARFDSLFAANRSRMRPIVVDINPSGIGCYFVYDPALSMLQQSINKIYAQQGNMTTLFANFANRPLDEVLNPHLEKQLGE